MNCPSLTDFYCGLLWIGVTFALLKWLAIPVGAGLIGDLRRAINGKR